MPGEDPQGGTGNDLDAQAAAYLKRFGDPAKAVAELMRDNRKAREKARRARESAGTAPTNGGTSTGATVPISQYTELQIEHEATERELQRVSGMLPPAGSLVLAGADVETWRAVSGFLTESKLTPAQIKEAIAERDTLKTADAQRARDVEFDAAATALDYKPAVLRRLAKSEGLELQMRDVTEKGDDGKTTTRKHPHVRKAGNAAAPWEPLDVVVERDLADFLPSLQVEGTGNASGNGKSGDEATGTAFVSQTPPQKPPAKGGDTRKVVDNYLGARYDRPSNRGKEKGATGAK